MVNEQNPVKATNTQTTQTQIIKSNKQVKTSKSSQNQLATGKID